MDFQFHGFGFDLAHTAPTIVNINPKDEDDSKITIIYDLDGTLSDDSHRKHFVEGDVKDYPSYLDAMRKDKPVWEVIKKLIEDQQGGAIIGLLTGRPDTYMMETIRQLYEYQIAGLISFMMMRNASSAESTLAFKERALGLMVNDGMVLAGIVDDNADVRAMATDLGIVATDPADILEAAKAPKLVGLDGKVLSS